jgi:hypothetical protein
MFETILSQECKEVIISKLAWGRMKGHKDCGKGEGRFDLGKTN